MEKIFLALCLSAALSACGGANRSSSAPEAPAYHPPLAEPVYLDNAGNIDTRRPGAPNQYESWEHR